MKPRTKITVEECPTLDVRSLPDAGYFDPSVKRGRVRLRRGDREIASLDVAMSEDGLHLQYDVFLSEGTRTRVSSVVAVVRTPAINTGERVWFSCPGCHQLASKLYLPRGKDTFLCRACHNLTYASQQKRPNIWQQVEGGVAAAGGGAAQSAAGTGTPAESRHEGRGAADSGGESGYSDQPAGYGDTSAPCALSPPGCLDSRGRGGSRPGGLRCPGQASPGSTQRKARLPAAHAVPPRPTTDGHGSLLREVPRLPRAHRLGARHLQERPSCFARLLPFLRKQGGSHHNRQRGGGGCRSRRAKSSSPIDDSGLSAASMVMRVRGSPASTNPGACTRQCSRLSSVITR